MNVDHFVEFMFLKNVNNYLIDLQLGGIEDTKDLFCFFVDLLCKGLVLLYGQNGKIELEKIEEDQFQNVARKMMLAGIKTHLNIIPNESSKRLGLEFKDENYDTLDEYEMNIIANDKIYNIRFSLIYPR